MATPGGSSSCTHSWSHDVFLSFRGADTRYTFTCHLREYLIQKGIKTFIDDNELNRGEEITPALLKAIEESRISVIVFSENYAFSEWCLDELTHILYCRKSKQQTVYPVFYKVDPSDVQDQKGSFGQALAYHECRFKDDSAKVAKWKGALIEASNLAGWEYKDGYESIFIATIVEKISMQVCCHADFIVAHCPVGIDCQLKEMHNLLGDGLNDVRMIGIWGIAGIGKTTIAKAVYKSLACKFDGCCFLENVGKVSMKLGGPVKLRNMLLSKILRVKESDLLTDACEGMNVIENRLSRKRVLLILDAVDQLEQLRYLVGKSEWFGLGSRIIITTRDKHILAAHGVRENQIYKPKELDEHEALELFRANAFPQESLPDGYAQLEKDVLEYAQGLPLALQYLGTLLYDRTVEEWKEELHSRRKYLQADLHENLIISYNELDSSVKQVFLDIACFFKGKHKNHVIQILEKSDVKPMNSIKILQEKALIHIQENHICMHNLLELLGKEIVHMESSEPAERSRLWFLDDVYKILSEGQGTNKIKGVIVSPSPHEIPLSDTCFSGMTNLKYFISSNAEFSGNIACLPNELRLIDWPRFPFECLPPNYVPKELVKLYMPHSRILQLGENFKRSRNLKYINLENCQLLEEIPNFSGFPNLRDLNLNDCTSLVEVDDSVGTLNELVALSLSGCHNLVTFPTRIALKSVKRIIFRDCRSLTALPAIVQKMEFLTLLDLSGTGIKELPDASIRYLISLQELILRECENLTSLPCSIYELQYLRYLNLHNCSKLVALPEWNIEVLPTDLISSNKLWGLNLGGCKQLLKIPQLPPAVGRVNADDCVQLERFAKLSNIMEHKESQMIGSITLYNCQRLCHSLIHDMEETKNIRPSPASLCSLFLSCRQSEFEVVFPGSEVPEWFSRSKKLKELTEESKFSFEISPNFRLWNQGLAICAVAEVVERTNPKERNNCSVTATIDINAGSKIARSFHFDGKIMESGHEIMKSGHVWLCYIPFIIFTCSLSPPFTCGVTLEHKSQGSVHCISYGVHLVMP